MASDSLSLFPAPTVTGTPVVPTSVLPTDGPQLQLFVIIIIALGTLAGVLLVFVTGTIVVLYCCGRAPPTDQHDGEADDTERSRSRRTSSTQQPVTSEENRRTLLLPRGRRVSRLLQPMLQRIGEASTRHIRFGRSRVRVGWRENLHNQLPKQRVQALEIPYSAVCLTGDLKETNFGKVYKGEALGIHSEDTASTTVLVKSLREESDVAVQQLFNVEMVCASGFYHPNILTLLGVCTSDTPRYMVYEYLEFGPLDAFLQSTAAVWIDFDSIADTDASTSTQQLVGVDELLNIGLQVVNAIDYLAGKGFVHKDIAARNCHVSVVLVHLVFDPVLSIMQVGPGLHVKLANFGLSYELHSADYCSIASKENYPLPLRWLAPESLKDNQFSTYSDVWSYGVLLWEVMSLGARPYAAMNNAQVAQSILTSHLLPQPKHCPPSVYTMMQQCWARAPQQRLTFSSIRDRLKVFIAAALDQSATSAGSTHRVSVIRVPSATDVTRQ